MMMDTPTPHDIHHDALPGEQTGTFDHAQIRAEVRRLLSTPDMQVTLARQHARAQHWYWRAWWRLRYLPYELAGALIETRAWLLRHTALGE